MYVVVLFRGECLDNRPEYCSCWQDKHPSAGAEFFRADHKASFQIYGHTYNTDNNRY